MKLKKTNMKKLLFIGALLLIVTLKLGCCWLLENNKLKKKATIAGQILSKNGKIVSNIKFNFLKSNIKIINYQ